MTTTDNQGASAELKTAIKLAGMWAAAEHEHARNLGRGGPGEIAKVEKAEAAARAAIEALAAQPVAARVEAAPQAEPLSDDEIERLALKHVATDWHLISHLIPNYRCTEQFARLKAFAEELAGRCRAQGGNTQPSTATPERAAAPADNFRARQEFLDWNRAQSAPLVAVGKEYAAFEKIASLLATARAAEGDALEPVEGDLLPPVGSKVLIHLGRQDAWVEHTVAGYYVWGALSHQLKEGEKNAHRVFVRVKDANGYDNARLLSEVRRPSADQQASAQKGGSDER